MRNERDELGRIYEVKAAMIDVIQKYEPEQQNQLLKVTIQKTTHDIRRAIHNREDAQNIVDPGSTC